MACLHRSWILIGITVAVLVMISGSGQAQQYYDPGLYGKQNSQDYYGGYGRGGANEPSYTSGYRTQGARDEYYDRYGNAGYPERGPGWQRGQGQGGQGGQGQQGRGQQGQQGQQGQGQQGEGQQGGQGYAQGNQGTWDQESAQGNTWRGQGNRRMEQVTGRVLHTKRVTEQGSDREFLAALVETNDGSRMVVDLGPIQSLRDQDIRVRSDDWITARGSFLWVGEHHVLMAQQLNADGTGIEITRRMEPSTQRLESEERMLNRDRQQAYRNDWDRYSQNDRYGSRDPYSQGSSNWDNGYGQQYSQRGDWDQNYQNRRYQRSWDQGEPGDRYARSRDEDYRYGERGHNQQGGIRQAGWQEENQEGQLPWRHVSGQIVQTKTLQLPGTNDQIMVAQIETNQGQRYYVNLGPKDDLGKVTMNPGVQISVRGPLMTMAGHKFMLAEEGQINNQTMSFQQGREPRQWQDRCTVERTQQIQMPGMESPMLVAVCRTEEGEQCLVNCGPAREMEDVQLNAGDTMFVRGWMMSMKGHQMVMAQEVRAHGQTMHVSGTGDHQSSWQR